MTEIHIAENLLRLRTFHNYTQEEVSRHLHIARQTYSNYERGTRLPDMHTAVRIASFYRISLDLLISSPDPARQIAEQQKGYRGITPPGSSLPMTNEDAHMFMSYQTLPASDRKEIQDYVRFKKRKK